MGRSTTTSSGKFHVLPVALIEDFLILASRVIVTLGGVLIKGHFLSEHLQITLARPASGYAMLPWSVTPNHIPHTIVALHQACEQLRENYYHPTLPPVLAYHWPCEPFQPISTLPECEQIKEWLLPPTVHNPLVSIMLDSSHYVGTITSRAIAEYMLCSSPSFWKNNLYSFLGLH